MLKWVVGLCVAIYGTLMIFGGDGYRPPAEPTPLKVSQSDAPDESVSSLTPIASEPMIAEIEPATPTRQAPAGEPLIEMATAAPPEPRRVSEQPAEAVLDTSREAAALMPQPVNVTALEPQGGIPAIPEAAIINQVPSAIDIEAAVLEAAPPEPPPTPPVLAEVSSPADLTVARAPEIWTVTGARVNLREGPSTDTRVIGRTVRGDSAELIELRDDGWAKVFVIDVGIEAYISASFLTPENLAPEN